MKKHPIDDLFAQRLANAEITPRAEAWARLQQKQEAQQKRVVVWWRSQVWAVAASISIILIAGWLYWKNTNPAPTAQPLVAKVETKTTEPVQTNMAEEKVSAVVSKKVPTKRPQKISESQSATGLTIAYNEPNVTIEKNIVKTEITVEPLPTQPTETHIEIAKGTMPSATPTEQTLVLQLPDIQVSDVVVARVVRGSKPTEMIAKNDTENPHKSTRFSKVWKQLKNAKTGEKIDWDEVGFNPNKLLAKATSKNQ